MNEVLLDTHSLLWSIFDSKRLSSAAATAFQNASNSGRVYISAISLIEIHYLQDKKKFPYLNAFPTLMTLVNSPR